MAVPTTIEFPVELPAVRVGTGPGGGWEVEVAGVRVSLSNLDKPYWKPEGYTKGDLLAYYYAIAPTILPYLRGRPLTMKRMPDGADGDFFYAKQAPAGTPDWVRTAPVVSADTGKTIEYVLAEDTASLLHIANLGCIEMHPWHSRVDDLGHPDYAFFDLDPFDVGFDVVRDVALLIKTVLDQVGLRGYARTSGATGMQVYVPVDRVHTASAVRDWVGAVCRLVNRADPAHTTMEWDIGKRSGKVFLDHGMNTEGRNIAATYSVRPERGAPVATPLEWDEVGTDVEPRDFTMATLWPRLDAVGDLFAPVLAGGQDLRAAMAAVGMDPEEQSGEVRHRVARPAGPQGPEGHDGPGADVGPDGPEPQSAGGAPDEEAGDLSRYRDMRDFTKTPEPSDEGVAPEAAGRRFVIQHHLATRLHHDLRLERGGTARSWALPKGLPDTPGVRHLAVQTEDHPLRYLTFSGEIPRGEYGAGPVRIWDAGTYEPVEWEEGKVTFRLDGRRHHGEWHLFRPSDAEPRQWLVTRAGQPEPLPPEPPPFRPMLASDGDGPFDDDEWLFEVKWDGVRVIAALERPRGGRDGRAVLTSRAGNDVSAGYPELGPLWERMLARNAVVDGEIVAMGPDGKPSFNLLQQRMHVRDERSVARLRQRIPATYMVFDVLAVDGEALVDRQLTERLSVLDDLLVPGGAWERSRTVRGTGRALFEAAQERGLEGVIAKRADSLYTPGRRTAHWRKIKVRRTASVVVGGWLPGQGRLDGTLGSLFVGAWDDGTLRFVGRVGTGFDEAERRRLEARLAPLETGDDPFADLTEREPGLRFVRPEVVCAVEFTEFTDANRLRAPAYKGLCPDTGPREPLLVDLRGG